jgi:glycogen phosphorylase
VKRVAYLSLEFLLGRSLQNAIFNLGLRNNYLQAMQNLGLNLEDVYDTERDAGLGNGGLGRLAACFLDSLATLDLPAWGYGLRYTYGMFYQKIKDGNQIEFPDYWLIHGNPWELERMDVIYPVKFYGHVHEIERPDGSKKVVWEGGEEVLAVAYDSPIPGYRTFNTLNIRLWSAKPSREFDLEHFNKGDFFKSIEDKQRSENITHVLYPNDNTPNGKELRLKQQYFFVSATIKDLIRRFKRRRRPIHDFAQLVAIQLNDTHPTLGIVELMRVLLDQEECTWEQAWQIVIKTFAYTNHTVLPEALERWPVPLLESLLPRHLRIIYDINFQFLKQVEAAYPGDIEKLRRMSLIEEGSPRMIRMAHLAIVGSHAVNGVAAIHSELLRTTVFKDFHEFFPNKFSNKTNGVTPRRWMHQANPLLSVLISTYLQTEDWLLNLDLLTKLRPLASSPQLQRQWADVKRQNKERLAAYIKKELGIVVSVDSLFDVQIKRIHEYKRQLLNILYIIFRYRQLKMATAEERNNFVPRTVIFGGKAAPGYYMAKLIIKLICSVADVVNHDKETSDFLKIVFIPNYCVSLAEIIIPASEVSQHISTAGMEASGTSNMKFAMNGSLIVGTLDGANIEIKDHIRDENIFIFGATAAEVPELRTRVREGTLKPDPRFREVLAMVQIGTFGPPGLFDPIVHAVTGPSDYYLLGYDFSTYADAQDRIDAAYKDQQKWNTMSIMSTAGMGYFSSDRTIREYAKEIWNVQPCRRPGPMPVAIERLSSSGVVPKDVFSPATRSGLPMPSTNVLTIESFSPNTK